MFNILPQSLKVWMPYSTKGTFTIKPAAKIFLFQFLQWVSRSATRLADQNRCFGSRFELGREYVIFVSAVHPLTARLTERLMTEHLNRIIRERDVDEYCGLGRTQRAELIRRGEFPKPVRLSDTGRARGYLESELIEWQRRRAAERNLNSGD